MHTAMNTVNKACLEQRTALQEEVGLLIPEIAEAALAALGLLAGHCFLYLANCCSLQTWQR